MVHVGTLGFRPVIAKSALGGSVSQHSTILSLINKRFSLIKYHAACWQRLLASANDIPSALLYLVVNVLGS